ncbi:MAG TPA: hypothetical protein VEG39_00170 [Clostridia bacterium]|nr:hypothetical protein [Clostridia bacterium]
MDITTQKLTEWAINKIKTEYLNDVALLIAVEGHSVNGDGHGECFDYFVPATNKGNELSQTFIINGIGYDLYPRSWERTERTANLDDRATICLGNAKILYSRTKEDEDRFNAIRNKLYDNLNNKEFTYKKALENLNIAMDLYRTMMFENELYKVRMASGYISYYLSLAVAYLNGTFFKNWRDGQLPELLTMKSIPDNFIEYYKGVINAKNADELKCLAYLIISTARQFIASQKTAPAAAPCNSNFTDLADWYQELSLTWRRLRYYCHINSSDAAFGDACLLQNELSIVSEEFGLREMDLLGCFDATDLNKLINQATELEKYIVSEIESHGVKLKNYDTLDAFLSKN